MEFKDKLSGYQAQVEAAIPSLFPDAQKRPARIHTAMLYSMEAGGKRLRPSLLLAANELFGGESPRAMPAAVAVESLHTYSLVHDDLPAVDNGALRRGKPTSHKKFDEATAILAGDALLTYAFQLLASHYASTPETCAQLVGELADTAGSQRLIGGQMQDILGEGAPLSEEALSYIHLNKTSALIECSLVMGGIVAGASREERDLLRAYGREIGLLFQITDDILDATSNAETLGKDAGSDADLKKTTYPKLYGLEQSKSHAAGHAQEAAKLCACLPQGAPFLSALAAHLERRLS